MTCLIGLMAMAFPRVAVILVVIFSDYIGTAYQTTIWPLLGFVFMPVTTLAYAWAMHSSGSVDGLQLVVVVIAVLSAIEERGLLANVQTMGARLQAALEARFGQHPHIGDIRGRGLFTGIELVANRETKAPFEPGRKLHAAIKKAAMAEGLMCYPMGGTVDGEAGDHILLAPPYIIDEAHIGEIVERLGRALDKTLPQTTAA